MKRLIVVLCVVSVLVALSFSHEAMAKKGGVPAKPVKVAICHATDGSPLMSGGTLIVGHVINVSENAVPAHLAHGDSATFSALDDPGPWAGHTWGELAEWYELDLEGVNCAARLP